MLFRMKEELARKRSGWGENGEATICFRQPGDTEALKVTSKQTSKIQFDPIQVELNFAHFASFIFTPSHSLPFARSKIWVIEQNGEKMLSKILVEPVNGEILTTFDYRTFLALQKLVDDTEGLRDLTSFSLKGLANIMEISWGKKRRNLLKNSLRRLRKVPITWQYAFKHRDHIEMIEEPITILSKLRLHEAYSNATARSSNVFRFNEYIEKNLIEGYRRPMFFREAMSIRGEIALALYNLLDIVMTSKTSWQRRCQALLREDLNILGKYQWPAERHRIVNRAIQQLLGKPISTGVLETLSLKHTKDGSDYKLIVRKRATKRISLLRQTDSHQAYLIEQILTLTRDTGSQMYYAKLARELSEEQIYFAISETKQAVLNGEVETSPSRYFGGIASRMLRENTLTRRI